MNGDPPATPPKEGGDSPSKMDALPAVDMRPNPRNLRSSRVYNEIYRR